VRKTSIQHNGLPGLILIVAVSSMCVAANAPPECKLPELKPQPTPQAVVKEHFAALNAYDWQRLPAQYPQQIEIHFPNGGSVAGRQKVVGMFEDICTPHEAGGFKGAVFTALHTTQVGDRLMVQWVVNAPFLLESYKGVDAFITKDGLLVGQVTTFNGADMKFKKESEP
jgi:hypothetical protein